MVLPHAPKLLVGTTRERRRDGAGVAAGIDRPQTVHCVRQNSPRLHRLDLEGGNEQDEAQARINREFLMPVMARHDEPAEFGRGGIIGMSLELGTEAENLGALERMPEKRVQSVEQAEPQRDAASEPAGAGHLARDRARKGEGFAARRAKKSAACLPGHGAGFDLARPRHRNEVINPQGHAEAIEAGTEIRSRGRNADRDLLFFQMKSAESASQRGMTALILTCAIAAARPGQDKA